MKQTNATKTQDKDNKIIEELMKEEKKLNQKLEVIKMKLRSVIYKWTPTFIGRMTSCFLVGCHVFYL